MNVSKLIYIMQKLHILWSTHLKSKEISLEKRMYNQLMTYAQKNNVRHRNSLELSTFIMTSSIDIFGYYLPKETLVSKRKIQPSLLFRDKLYGTVVKKKLVRKQNNRSCLHQLKSLRCYQMITMFSSLIDTAKYVLYFSLLKMAVCINLLQILKKTSS